MKQSPAIKMINLYSLNLLCRIWVVEICRDLQLQSTRALQSALWPSAHRNSQEWQRRSYAVLAQYSVFLLDQCGVSILCFAAR